LALRSAFLAAAVVLNAGSSLFYKYSSLSGANKTLSALLLAAGLSLGAINAVLYTKSLGGINLNTAYPVFSACSLILVSVLALLVFGEEFSLRKVAGIAVLAAGVALVSL
jgi:multidrug transporter EmrE-like cation transporter